jgi:hypothetical protein
LLRKVIVLAIVIVIFGLLIAVVPRDRRVPLPTVPLVLGSLVAGVLLGWLQLRLPHQARSLQWTFLFLVMLAALALFCNLVALGPNFQDETSKAYATREVLAPENPWTRGGYAISAFLVNTAFIATLTAWLRSLFRDV